jgi:hypothetical protein
MAKDSRRAVLYEVIKRKYGKVPMGKKLAQPYQAGSLRSSCPEEKTGISSPEQPIAVVGARPVSRIFVAPPRKRSILVSYPIALLMGLVLVLAIFGGFRLVQVNNRKINELQTPDKNTRESVLDTTVKQRQIAVTQRSVALKETAPKPIPSTEKPPVQAGDHVIVIATYKRGEDIVPVKEYFDKNGIKTEIQERNGYFFLVTADMFQNPKRADSDGYPVLQRIKEIGAKYKAPAGYETFAPNYFQDAYPMKIRLKGELLDVY